MEISGSIIVLAIVFMVIILSLLFLRRWRQNLPAAQPRAEREIGLPLRASQASVDPSKLPHSDALEAGEFQASATSEQIEDMVRQRLKRFPELSDVDIDFGTAPDGSLEIWISGELYRAVDEIPDGRIQQAIEEAVKAFNE